MVIDVEYSLQDLEDFKKHEQLLKLDIIALKKEYLVSSEEYQLRMMQQLYLYIKIKYTKKSNSEFDFFEERALPEVLVY